MLKLSSIHKLLDSEIRTDSRWDMRTEDEHIKEWLSAIAMARRRGLAGH